MSLSKGGTGISYENNRYPEEFFGMRKKIRERDNYTCHLCWGYGNAIHHIDYNGKNNDESNLMVLCKNCNLLVNNNREHWTIYFNRLMVLPKGDIIDGLYDNVKVEV